MYEYKRASGGLGWSDYLQNGQFVPCDEVVGGVRKCFTTTSADRLCAENSGCFELRGQSCTTTSGGTGTQWCCPRHLPPPPGYPCVPQSTNMVCRRHDNRCSSFSTSRECGICQIQKALCDLGIDAGPVDGRGASDMYRIAIRMFQARNGLPVTGEVTLPLLERLNLQATCATAATGSGPSGPGVGLTGSSMQLFWPLAFSVSSVFLIYALWRHGRGRR